MAEPGLKPLEANSATQAHEPKGSDQRLAAHFRLALSIIGAKLGRIGAERIQRRLWYVLPSDTRAKEHAVGSKLRRLRGQLQKLVVLDRIDHLGGEHCAACRRVT